MTIRANRASTRAYGRIHVSLGVVTSRASGDDSSGEVTPKLPRSSVVVGDPKEPASWRRGPKAGASYRTFGTVSPTRGRWKAFYVGPDRHRHTAGLTFSNQVRAQGWLANELGLIERGEWTPLAERRRQVEAAALIRGSQKAVFSSGSGGFSQPSGCCVRPSRRSASSSISDLIRAIPRTCGRPHVRHGQRIHRGATLRVGRLPSRAAASRGLPLRTGARPGCGAGARRFARISTAPAVASNGQSSGRSPTERTWGRPARR